MIKLPTELNLLAIRENWQLHYEEVNQSRISTKKVAPYELLIKSPSLSRGALIPTIEAWLKRKGQRHLITWLEAISDDMQIPYQSVSIRGQRSRWGSCSANHALSINYKLLFLPAPLVDYILVHELCHTRHLNHSKHFWQLVETHEPDYRKKRCALKQCQLYLPTWLE